MSPLSNVLQLRSVILPALDAVRRLRVTVTVCTPRHQRRGMRGRTPDARLLFGALAAVLALGLAPRASGGESANPAPTVSPKRAVPDYDGRGRTPAPAANAALWIPRIVLAPAYLVSEYVLRAPLAVAIPAAERVDLPRKVYDFFTFGPEHKAGVVPVGLVEF